MKKLFLSILLLMPISIFAGYQVPYPAQTSGKNTLHFAIQSIFKSTYTSSISTQQEHFIGFMHYGFLDVLDIGITANYHIIDVKTPIGTDKNRGIGDPSLYVRWFILESQWVNLGLKCDLNIPLGNRYFGSGTATHNSIFISEFNLIYLRPYITFGHYTTSETNGYFRFNFGIQKMIVQSWIPFIDVYTEINQKGHTTRIPCWVVVGSIIKIKEHGFRIEYIINTKKYFSERGFFALRYMYNFKQRK